MVQHSLKREKCSQPSAQRLNLVFFLFLRSSCSSSPRSLFPCLAHTPHSYCVSPQCALSLFFLSLLILCSLFFLLLFLFFLSPHTLSLSSLSFLNHSYHSLISSILTLPTTLYIISLFIITLIVSLSPFTLTRNLPQPGQAPCKTPPTIYTLFHFFTHVSTGQELHSIRIRYDLPPTTNHHPHLLHPLATLSTATTTFQRSCL
ncbi:MAG: hypothetical protein JOS17DRAFT_228320 [Linnemannia elongata]|nr:MAG: hypothetical protein JOS17DRAFT_228320 [Linnemannia elongata]